ncbi:MAG: ATP-binding protein [Dichotomicrobium sp.]
MRLAALLPTSFRGRLLLLVLGALLTAQAVSLGLLLNERRLAVRAVLGGETLGRVANILRLIESAPPAMRTTVLGAAASPLTRLAIGDSPLAQPPPDPGPPARLADRLAGMLGPEAGRAIGVRFLDAAEDTPFAGPAWWNAPGRDRSEMHGMHEMHERMRAMRDGWRGGQGRSRGLAISVRLQNGGWLNVETRLSRPPLQFAWPALVATALGALLVTVVVWLSVRGLARPIRALAQGAERVGRGEMGQSIPSDGPDEIRRATEAFNRMQARLGRLLDERTRMVAALGHDLRSPLAAMRVRLEMIEDGEDRDRLIRLVEEMERMSEATLAYGRGVAGDEPPALREISALVAEALAEGGLEAARVIGGEAIRVSVRPTAMKRALRNLVDNALTYGGDAEIAWRETSGDGVVLTVEDHGPGLPEEQLEAAFDPFFRFEDSRSRETGGAGLGLAIARDIVQSHGGTLTLTNRPEGGLRATLTLPCA